MTQLDLFPIAKSSQQDTHVNPSPLPGTEKAQKMTATSGRTLCKLLHAKDPLGAFSKMLVVTSHWVSTRCYLTWKPKITPQGRLLFQLAVSMPPINETGSGLWLTPTATQTDEHPEVVKKRMEKYPNGTTVGSLTSQVKYAPPLWATPNTMDSLPAGISQASKEAKKGSKKKVKQSSRPSERASNVGDPECRRLSGFDGWRSGEKSTDGCEDVVKNRKSFWSIEPDVGRVAHGIPKRVDRIRGLGNAIVPQIAEQIGRVIKEIDDASRV